MIEPSLFEAITRTGFVHRGRRRADGSYAYMLRDGSGAVLVPPCEWERIGTAYGETVRKAKKRAIIIVFGLPWAIMAYALLLAPILPHIVAITLLLGGLLAWAGSWLTWYPWKVLRASQAAEQRLRRFPPTEPLPLDPARQPRVLQIVFLALVGPNLILSLIGEIGGPDTFRNTPMVGASMGPWQYLAVLVMIGWHLWPRLTGIRRTEG